MSLSDITLEFQHRISATEERVKQAERVIAKHDILLEEMSDQMRDLVLEVKQIRNALYFMAVAIASNVPVVGDLVGKLKIIFGF